MAGNPLWAHLLRRDVIATESLSQIPPIAPQDKTGTSMRLLIHDTQVNLEKFSTRLDGLLQRVDDCRAQVVNANKLLDIERDKVLTEILEIANRCQSELKAHVGTPAQAPAIDLVHVTQVSMEKSLQGLEKRMDTLQALLQTHVHAMQSIQDQQNALIGAVLPLVPIIHGVPSQIDQIKAALSDMVTNAVSTMTDSVENVRLMLVAKSTYGHGCVESPHGAGPLSKSISSSRRRRPNALDLDPQEIGIPVLSPSSSRYHGGAYPNVKRARVESATYHTGIVQLPRKTSRLAVPLTESSEPLTLLQTPRTPRQPLTDLLLPPSSNTPVTRHRLVSHVNLTSRGYMRTLETAGSPSIIPTPRPRPLLQPLEHAHPDPRGPTITRQQSTVLHDLPLTVDNPTIVLPSAVGPSDQDTISKAIKTDEVLEPNSTGVFSVRSCPVSPLPSSVPLAPCRSPRGTSADMAQLITQQHIRQREDMRDASLAEAVQVPAPLPGPLSSNPDSSPPKSMSLRDRRAQISKSQRSETRRFIPLVPWSDEEE